MSRSGNATASLLPLAWPSRVSVDLPGFGRFWRRRRRSEHAVRDTPGSLHSSTRAEPGFIQQALDIPIGRTAYVGADHQRFQWSRTDDAADVRDYATHGAFDRTAHLWHGDSDLALGGLD